MIWVDLVRISIAFVFLGAVAGKWRNPAAFVEALRGYELVPARLVPAAAISVLVGETILAASLLLSVAVQGALLASAGLLLVFAGVVARTAHRDAPLDCGCLGSAVSLRLGWTSVVANLALAAAAAAAAAAAGDPLREMHFESRLTLWVSGALLGGLYWLVMYSRGVLEIVEDRLNTGLPR